MAIAHVGSPTVFFQGYAGAYHLRVTIRPPETIPGTAAVVVQTDTTDVQRVSVRPIRWDAGPSGAPPPEECRPVQGSPRVRSAELWLMTPGSYYFFVEVAGTRGVGTAIVPVSAVATRKLGLSLQLSLMLAGLGVLLSASLLVLLNAAGRESTLGPERALTAENRRNGRLSACCGAIAISVALVGGKIWWKQEDARAARRLHRPYHLVATTWQEHRGRRLQVTIDDPRWLDEDWRPLIPDHGKWMHLFMARVPAFDVFAHLHPRPKDQRTFTTTLPPLPLGQYLVFVDIAQENGFAQTLTASVELPAIASGSPAGRLDDVDDAFSLARAISDSGTATLVTAALDGGLTMIWHTGSAPSVEGVEGLLQFDVLDEAGRPVELEPYLGMPGHAIVLREDAAIFTHLHPNGTISMAAQRAFLDRERDVTSPRALHESHGPERTTQLRFPFAFPAAGSYRVWVQVQVRGQVLTGAYIHRVAPKRP